MATVEYIGIGKRFGTVEVMRDLNLFKEDGAFTVLLGPSGCGKTTLLRMTAGLESVSAGDIMIGGRRVNDVHPRDRNIAMVFQNYALYPTMKVFDNIAFSLQVKKMASGEIKRRVEEAAATLNISEYLDRYPKELSGGQRQRVAMGRAMVREAEVFLFDEPLSNLDAKLRSHMRVEIRLLHQRLGATTIYVTHDQIEAMTMADKIVLMRAGEIEQIGTPDEVYDRPANKFAADFIGSPSMNFMSGAIEADSAGGMAFNASGVRIPVNAESVGPGRRVICGIRPNDVEISAEGTIDATLQIAETTGADVQLHTKVGELELVALASRGTRFASGDSMTFAVDPAKLHLFDAATEQRIN